MPTTRRLSRPDGVSGPLVRARAGLVARPAGSHVVHRAGQTTTVLGSRRIRGGGLPLLRPTRARLAVLGRCRAVPVQRRRPIREGNRRCALPAMPASTPRLGQQRHRHLRDTGHRGGHRSGPPRLRHPETRPGRQSPVPHLSGRHPDRRGGLWQRSMCTTGGSGCWCAATRWSPNSGAKAGRSITSRLMKGDRPATCRSPRVWCRLADPRFSGIKWSARLLGGGGRAAGGAAGCR